MKYTIMGFNQDRVMSIHKDVQYNNGKTKRLSLDIVDLCILRWFIDFQNSGHMQSYYFKTLNQTLYQINYQAFVNEYPILGIDNSDTVYRHCNKLVALGLLMHDTLRIGGTYAYYGVTETLISLLYKSSNTPSDLNPNPTDEKPEGYGLKTVPPTDLNPEQKNPSTINPSTKSFKDPLTPIEGIVFHTGGIDDTTLQEALQEWSKYKLSLSAGKHYKTQKGWDAFVSQTIRTAHRIGVDATVQAIHRAIAKKWTGTHYNDIKADNTPCQDADMFEECWKQYQFKGNKTASVLEWNALTHEQRENAIKAIESYMIEQPVVAYRKDLENYLRLKIFDDVLERKSNNALLIPPVKRNASNNRVPEIILRHMQWKGEDNYTNEDWDRLNPALKPQVIERLKKDITGGLEKK